MFPDPFLKLSRRYFYYLNNRAMAKEKKEGTDNTNKDLAIIAS
jgi:hypothetical protein